MVVGVMDHFGSLPLLVPFDQGLWGFASRMRGNRGNAARKILRRSSVGSSGKSVDIVSMDFFTSRS